ncbi:hypothetical protein [Actinomadura sp. HBU206391]|uniref:hypothetical protein n=1 Tax=Actinomadura sp. HBU206391 TaxID=2731692 RepID=UPI001D9A18FC|nr:hypothetical protein [Actinomadura sp. HBU206391]MBC6458684.1 hypothetical protein [Actinomadura sp. HBU206391]
MRYARSTPGGHQGGRLHAVTRRLALPALLAFIGILLFGWAAPARADTVSEIANGLRNSKLYVSSEAGGVLSDPARAQVRKALDAADHTDIRVVVTKAGLGQEQLGQMLNSVRQRVGKGDTYVAVTADDQMVGISKDLSATEINQLITQASGGDITTRLVKFAQLADAKAADKAASSRNSMFVGLGVLVLAVVGVVGLVAVVQRRRKVRDAQQMAELKQGVDEDVTSLGEDIAALDLKVTDPALATETREDYTRALDSYDKAKAAVETAQRPDDMRNVTTALEDGRYYMVAVRARLAGEAVPERRAPCFFNPQHGPSVEDVPWAPAGSAPRSVPACAADAQAVLNGMAPDSRMVPVGGGRRPYWEAGPAYAPYAGGYYAGYGGMDILGPILIGTALGSMLGGGFGGFGGMGGGLGGGGDVFGGDGGDIGGGWDFGSGDFGGGGGFGGGGDF